MSRSWAQIAAGEAKERLTYIDIGAKFSCEDEALKWTDFIQSGIYLDILIEYAKLSFIKNTDDSQDIEDIMAMEYNGIVAPDRQSVVIQLRRKDGDNFVERRGKRKVELLNIDISQFTLFYNAMATALTKHGM